MREGAGMRGYAVYRGGNAEVRREIDTYSRESDTYSREIDTIIKLRETSFHLANLRATTHSQPRIRDTRISASPRIFRVLCYLTPIMSDFIRVPASDLKAEFHRILIAHGFDAERASTCAEVFTNNSIDGIYSHGVNRFPRFVGMVKAGTVKPSADPVLKTKNGNVEQWNGQLGPGPLNALKATDRVIELAKSSGIGCVAMSHTNHWMRGG